MKRLIAMLLALLMLSGCATCEKPPKTVAEPAQQESPQENRFSSEKKIELSDKGIKTNALSVYASNDIVYYEDKDFYESGNPYGEGSDADKHTAEEADAHVVVNITEPGTYRVTGKLSAGQIRVDLGEDAYDDPNAVVELILDNVDITCTVAPAIVFLNVYECDGAWDKDTAKAEVDTSKAGANLILEGENSVSGSYVARIYKDKEGEKKLWKQDGAIYSYMSMNIFGPGALELMAQNEGIDTELHLTIHGGDLTIRSGNDGINTNEDKVSVTTINGGNIRIVAGLGIEGDGIDSNGYLVINGGTVVSAAHPASDAGLDSDCGSYINGGIVVALGSTMDWAESESDQVTMNLKFADYRDANDQITVTKEDGSEVFSFDPATDAVMAESARPFMGAIVSCPDLKQGESYLIFVGGVQMCYTGTDVRRHHGGSGEVPEEGKFPERMDGRQPADMDLPREFGGPIPTQKDWEKPREEDTEGLKPEEFAEPFPEHMDGQQPADMDLPIGFGGPIPTRQDGEGNTLFFMQDKVNNFSGLGAVTE